MIDWKNDPIGKLPEIAPGDIEIGDIILSVNNAQNGNTKSFHRTVVEELATYQDKRFNDHTPFTYYLIERPIILKPGTFGRGTLKRREAHGNHIQGYVKSNGIIQHIHALTGREGMQYSATELESWEVI